MKSVVRNTTFWYMYFQNSVDYSDRYVCGPENGLSIRCVKKVSKSSKLKKIKTQTKTNI
jgi:hypothetical protein